MPMTLGQLQRQVEELLLGMPFLRDRPVLITCDERVRPFEAKEVTAKVCPDCTQSLTEIKLKPR